MAKADATVRAYRGDAEVFQAWCARYGFRSLPASSEAVADFLVAEAEAGRAASTIGRRCAAIRYAHKLARLPDPTDDEAVRVTVRSIRQGRDGPVSEGGGYGRCAGRHADADPGHAHRQARSCLARSRVRWRLPPSGACRHRRVRLARGIPKGSG